MQTQKALCQQLSKQGLNAQKYNRKFLQQKIIHMYEVLEQKTTQNLLLRKQNDDIKIQIDTINDLFRNVDLKIQNRYMEERTSQKNSTIPLQKSTIQKKKLQFKEQQQDLQYRSSSGGQQFRHIGQMQKQKQNSITHPSENVGSETQNSQFQRQTLKCEASPNPSSRVGSISKSKIQAEDQNTSRIIFNKVTIKDNNLNQKIQFLMKQNQTILKKMNQIQSNSLSRPNGQLINRNSKNINLDDRQTNFSGNITSIHSIQAKKNDKNSQQECTPQNRKHCSTNSLGSCGPSIDRK